MIDECCCIDVDGPDKDEEGHLRWWRCIRVADDPVADDPIECCECGGTIKVNARYEHVWGIWCGIEEEYRTCMVCVKIREDFLACGYHYGCLRDEIWECYGVELC